jgi:hypothetical protein
VRDTSSQRMVNETLWQAIFGRSPQGVFIIIDPRLRESYGQLRALPLVRRLGLETFTFTTSWRGFDLAPFRYRVINQHTSTDELAPELPIAQFIAQSTDQAR